MAIIGREFPADIIVAAPQVSARHAQIDHVREDIYMLTDLGSSNGTWVNDKRVASSFVRPGDRVRLGSLRVDVGQWVARIPREASVSAVRRTFSLCPTPPDLHWALVLLLTVVTGGIFGIVWWVREGQWARRQNPSSKATLFVALAVSLPVTGAFILVVFVGFPTAVLGVSSLAAAALSLPLMLLMWGVLVLAAAALKIAAAFDIRRSLEAYDADRFRGTRGLSGVLTFFFPLYYLQYHMSRLAAAERAGGTE